MIAKNTFGAPVQQSDVLRLNSDRSVDNSFNTGTSANGRINVILALPTRKIFVGGKFSDFNGQTRQNLAQLNADGSFDPTTYTLNDEVLSLAVDSEGRVLVGGNFTVINANGTSANRSYVARLVDSPQSRNKRFDFDGDGRAAVSVFRASERNWFINRSSGGFTTANFGAPTDRVVPADYDANGKTDIAVFRSGNWYILKSSDSGFYGELFGFSTDKPIPTAFR